MSRLTREMVSYFPIVDEVYGVADDMFGVIACDPGLIIEDFILSYFPMGHDVLFMLENVPMF